MIPRMLLGELAKQSTYSRDRGKMGSVGGKDTDRRWLCFGMNSQSGTGYKTGQMI